MKKFFVRYLPPQIPNTDTNLQQVRELEALTLDFTNCINSSVGGSWCFSKELLFGRNDQAILILRTQFEGKQYNVEGADGNTIDCMFFPCTHKEDVDLFASSR